MKNTTPPLRKWRRELAATNLSNVPREKPIKPSKAGPLAAPPGARAWLWAVIQFAMQRSDAAKWGRTVGANDRRSDLLARLAASLTDAQANELIEWVHRPPKCPPGEHVVDSEDPSRCLNCGDKLSFMGAK